MKKNKTLYRKFVNDRNELLETILNNTRLKITDALNLCFKAMIEIYCGSGDTHHINFIISHTAADVEHFVLEMRRKVDVATIDSESAILGMITGKVITPRTNKSLDGELPSGGSVYDRTVYYLQNLSDRMRKKVALARLTDEPPNYSDLAALIPKRKRLGQKRRALKNVESRKLTEAVKPTLNFIDESEWQKILDDYKSQYVPKNRGPETFFDPEDVKDQTGVSIGQYDDAVYQWELEQDVTQDFVTRVREGQVEAANQNGYTDFVWVAVVDSVTDECCLWRDGLTTQQIELALSKEHSDDDCDATVPPAHFNCRCTLEPVTDNIEDLQPESNIGDFNAWLDGE